MTIKRTVRYLELPMFGFLVQIFLSTLVMGNEVLCFNPTENKCYVREGCCDFRKESNANSQAGREFCARIDAKRLPWCLPYSNMNKVFRSVNNECPPNALTLTDAQAKVFDKFTPEEAKQFQRP
jgi:hypothetical protein